MLLTQSGFHHLGQSAQYLLPKEGEGERHGWSLQLLVRQSPVLPWFLQCSG